MGHKYIEDLITLDKTPYGFSEGTGRDEKWKKERKVYGFDERETWSLDSTFFYWLYERVSMYNEVNIVDTKADFIKVRFNDKELTFQECIDFILENCKEIILSQETHNDDIIIAKENIINLWAKSYKLFWW